MSTPSGPPTFEGFVGAYSGALGRLCFQLTGSPDAALDLAQDVLERVYAKWPKVARADHPYAYVRRMAVNTHLNNTRRRLTTVASDPATLDRPVEDRPPAD